MNVLAKTIKTTIKKAIKRVLRRSSHEHVMIEQKIYAQRIGNLKVNKTQDYALVSYEKDGAFDYELYKTVQEAGNKRKLNAVFVREELIARIADHITPGPSIRSILCHGTRNGAEQALFCKYYGAVKVLGTEISETASQFASTIQWDFHDVKPEWIGHWDIIYSNSWDHSYDPVKLFGAWEQCLRPGGWMVVEHTRAHEADTVDPLDPFGVSFEGLVGLIKQNTSLAFEMQVRLDDDLNRRAAIFLKPVG